MRLWHKAWIESRVRFLLAASVMVIASIGAVVWHDPIRSALATRTAPLDTYNWYIYRVAYQGFARTVFMVFAFVLGLGGLLRERALGTAAFTLALPTSRLRIVLTRAAVGLLELIALAFLPAIVILTLSPAVGQAYPLSQALQFSLLWIAGGSALFAAAFFAASIFGGEYTAFVVAWIALFAHTVTTQFVRLRAPALDLYLFTVQEIMSGLRMSYFDPRTHLLIGPFPVGLVLALAAISGALVSSAAFYTQRRDF